MKNWQLPLVLIALGAFTIYWAQTHQPTLNNKLSGTFSGSYTMSEPWYYASLALGAALCIFGIFKLINKK